MTAAKVNCESAQIVNRQAKVGALKKMEIAEGACTKKDENELKLRLLKSISCKVKSFDRDSADGQRYIGTRAPL